MKGSDNGCFHTPPRSFPFCNERAGRRVEAEEEAGLRPSGLIEVWQG